MHFTNIRIPGILVTLAALSTYTFAATVSLTSLPYNFTLAALNLTLPNANLTGAPLVLGQNGASTGVTPHVTSTYLSYPYNDYPSLGLVDGSLRAYSPSGAWNTNATSVSSWGTLGWVTSTLYTHAAAQGYSVVQAPSDIYPVLAVGGVSKLWSLCPFSGFRGQTNVVFNVSADIRPPVSLRFNPADCYKVVLHVVPVL